MTDLRSQDGFTFPELLLTLVIVAVLAATMAPSFISAQRRQQIVDAAQQLALVDVEVLDTAGRTGTDTLPGPTNGDLADAMNVATLSFVADPLPAADADVSVRRVSDTVAAATTRLPDGRCMMLVSRLDGPVGWALTGSAAPTCTPTAIAGAGSYAGITGPASDPTVLP